MLISLKSNALEAALVHFARIGAEFLVYLFEPVPSVSQLDGGVKMVVESLLQLSISFQPVV